MSKIELRLNNNGDITSPGTAKAGNKNTLYTAMLDTGAHGFFGNRKFFEALGVDLEKPVGTEKIRTFGGFKDCPYWVLDEVSVFNITRKQVKAYLAFIDNRSGYNAIVGLRHFDGLKWSLILE